MIDAAYARACYAGSNGEATRALYEHLKTRGPAGELAVDLMRAAKNSERAKIYRGGGNKSAAYDTKQWALANICRTLLAHPLGIEWGWKVDPEMIAREDPHAWVLYVDLPTGQVSFHTDQRGTGPDYAGEWDGVRKACADRVLGFIAMVLEPAEAVA